MNIDRQLRAALSDEAERQNAPAPDVARLIHGGQVRQRRRNRARAAWAGVVAAASVLVAGGMYAVLNAGAETADLPAHVPTVTPSPSTSTPRTYTLNRSAIEPGTYRMLVGVDANDLPIDADLTFAEQSESGGGHRSWRSDNYPVLSDESGHYGGVAVYQPTALAAGTGCLSDKPNTHVGQTPQKLAQQLAQLPHSTVLQSPTPVQAFGHPAVHVQVRITNDCPNDIYRVAMTLRGGHGISYGHTSQTIIDFWVEDVGAGRPMVDDVGGVPVVVETWHQQGASSQLLDQIASTRDSIRFVTGQ
jgi:hypothetical protein